MKAFSSSIFQKLMIKIPIETIVRDFVLEYFSQKHGIVIDRKQIHLRKDIIEIRISPIIKSKLNPHTRDCIEKLNEFLLEKGLQLTIKKVL